MALSESQARALSALAVDPAQALTIQELAERAGVSDAAMASLRARGLAQCARGGWQITGLGRVESARPVYREYRQNKLPGTTSG